MIVSLGVKLESSPKDKTDGLAPVVEKLLNLRNEIRQKKQWKEADAIRDSLERADILIEDTKVGTGGTLNLKFKSP